MRPSRNCRAWVGAMLALVPVGLLAQPVYRCGSNYSQTPCANGIVVRADDPRTSDQKAQSDAATVQAARLADHMQRERLASEHSSSDAGNRRANGRPAQPLATTPAATRANSPEARSKAKARSQPPGPEHFIATTRQDVQKKPTAAPTRNQPATR